MEIDPILYEKYSKKQIDDAIAFLSYKHVDPMPKFESEVYPVLYIFRHGQTVDNESFVFSGWRDPELTQLGRKQAQALAEKLQDKKIDMLFSSTQRRAIETMEIAISLNDHAKDQEIRQDPRIKERSYGDYQGKSKLALQLEDPDLAHKVRRSYDYVPPNGESLAMVYTRVSDFCNSIIPLMKRYRVNVAVSCHGNSIRCFRKFFEGLTEEETATMETPLGQDYCSYIIS